MNRLQILLGGCSLGRGRAQLETRPDHPLERVGDNGRTPGQRDPKRRIFRSSPLREEWEVVADCVDGESMRGIAALRNRRVLAAQLRSRDNAVVGASLLIKR